MSAETIQLISSLSTMGVMDHGGSPSNVKSSRCPPSSCFRNSHTKCIRSSKISVSASALQNLGPQAAVWKAGLSSVYS